MTHSYSPDYQAMGDCRHCGNQPENCTGSRDSVHYCKHCTRTFPIRIPRTYTGDAIIKCSGCGWLHPRQIEAGIAVSCDPPRGKPITIEEHKLPTP